MNGQIKVTETGSNYDPSEIQNYDKALAFLKQHQNLGRHPHSLLAEYVTGIPMENYRELAERMIADKQLFREKYQLPDEGLKFSDPEQYVTILREIAQKHNLAIRPSDEYKRSTTTPLANGSLYDNKTHTIYLKPDSSPTDLEHELVHGLQDCGDENLGVEVKEYEAYGCAINVKKLFDPEWQQDIIGVFWGSIGAISAEAHYNDVGVNNPWTVPESMQILPSEIGN